jgi:hypothetical protein
VAADGNGRQAIIPPSPTGKHVAHRIDCHCASNGLTALSKPIAHLAILVSERQAAYPAFRSAADGSGFHDGAPKPITVNA